jgi:glycerol-3-phosphate acyltransferase PlsY
MIVAIAAGGYLLGSIPFAWLLTKAVTGKDLRTLGSGNVGVTNVAVQVTRWAGLLVFAGELAKGVLAVVISRQLEAGEIGTYVAVLATIAGTRWPVWLRFAGGRGNSAGAGALSLLSWPSLLIGLTLWGIGRVVTGSSFLATRIAFLLWPIVFGLAQGSMWAFAFGIVISSIYLTAQRRDTDDHTMIKENWSSLFGFLTSPRRK